ncbi:Probable Zinc-ribbon domain containing protein [Microbacteriaceae bacterium]
MKKLDSKHATEIMIKAGVLPLEDYPGSARKWKCKCLKCGQIVWPQHSSIKQNPGSGGCNPCAKIQTQVVLRKRNYENALVFLRENQLTLLGAYKSAKARARFRCDRCGTEFSASYTDFTSHSRTCTCKKLPRKALQESNPELAQELHPTANGLLTPEYIGTGMRTNVWWICPNKHEYDATPANRVAGTSCRYCLGMDAYEGESDLATLFPELCKELATKVELAKARKLRPGSNERLLWRCSKNDRHIYPMTPVDRINAGSGCSYCAGKRVLTGDNDFLTLFPEQAAEWDYDANFPQRPEMVHAGSNDRYAWICAFDSSHKWPASPATRQKSGCMKCSHFQTGRNDLRTKALQAGKKELIKEWDEVKNNRAASEVSYASNDSFYWICPKFPKKHSYPATVANRWFGGTGCPTCSPSSYDANSPGVLYFIENSALSARKIGITNKNAKTKRIEKFLKAGWTLILRLDNEDGFLIRRTEQILLRKVRDEHKLPEFLEKSQMRGMGGSTETFSSEGVTNDVLTKQIMYEYERSKSRLNVAKLEKFQLA